MPARAPAFHLQLRGYPGILRDGAPVPFNVRRGLALLAYLAEGGRRVGRVQLATLLWPDAPPATARARLRKLCHLLNGTLGAELLAGDVDSVWLDPEAAVIDSDTAAVRRCARQLLEHPEAAESRASLEHLCDPRAVRVLDGFDCGSEAFDEWLDQHRREQQRLVGRALGRIADQLSAGGQPALAAEAAAALVRLEPFAEAGHIVAMTARAQLGDAAGVEAAYFACADLLREELGIRPSAAIEAAYAQAHERLRGASQAPLPASPPIRFAETGEGSVAYLELGQALAPAGTLVILFGLWSHVEVAWEEPVIRSVLERLATRFRVVLMDRRGTGLSERLALEHTVAAGADDVEAVRRALGDGRVWLFGNSLGGCIALQYAALHPDRVRGLVLYASNAKGSAGPGYPWAASAAQLRTWLDQLRQSWGDATGLEQFAPSVASQEPARAWWARLLRQSASRNSMPALLEAFARTDVRPLLPAIEAPSLVVQREGDRIVRAGAARYLADHLPNAQLRMLPGDDHLMWFGDAGSVIDELERFVDRHLATR